MRSMFVVILVALLLGVGAVALIQSEPGYVLLAYGNYTLETSVWIGLLLLVLLTGLIYATIHILRRLLAGQKSVAGWLGSRQQRQSGRLTNRGLINFIEGNWAKSRRQLLRGARHHEAPLLNYLIAARGSYKLGESEKMREYLGAAERTDAEAGIAVELTQAELKLQAGRYEQAVATLVRARSNAGRHPYVLDLLAQGYLGLQDWEALLALLPELKKYQVRSDAELRELERNCHSELLQHSAASASPLEQLQQRWQAVPAPLKQDGELLRLYVRLLAATGATQEGAAQTAEKVILKALKQDWDSELVRHYGLIDTGAAPKQLATAEAWLPTHPRDPQLLLCLGRLSARDKLWGKSREYFESSYKQRRSPEVCAELGRLLSALGEPKVGARYFEEGLLLRENKLPQLPMPDRTPSLIQL